MVVQCKQDSSYQYTWELLLEAYMRRFPTHHRIPILLSSELIEETRNEDNTKVIYLRKSTLNIEAPSWIKALIGLKVFVFMQTVTIDKKERCLTIESHNETLKDTVKMHEVCYYKVHPDNPQWTYFTQTATFELQRTFFGIESLVEKLCRQSYLHNTKNGRNTDKDFINEILDEQETQKEKFVLDDQ
jgi:uncharacterized protein YbaR (Trm112 family)